MLTRDLGEEITSWDAEKCSVTCFNSRSGWWTYDKTGATHHLCEVAR